MKIIYILLLILLIVCYRQRSESFNYTENSGIIADVFIPSPNWIVKYDLLCSEYEYSNDDTCPDSSFTYSTNLKYISGNNDAAEHGCIQLKQSPYCYLNNEYKYVANKEHLRNVSP